MTTDAGRRETALPSHTTRGDSALGILGTNTACADEMTVPLQWFSGEAPVAPSWGERARAARLLAEDWGCWRADRRKTGGDLVIVPPWIPKPWPMEPLASPTPVPMSC